MKMGSKGTGKIQGIMRKFEQPAKSSPHEKVTWQNSDSAVAIPRENRCTPSFSRAKVTADKKVVAGEKESSAISQSQDSSKERFPSTEKHPVVSPPGSSAHRIRRCSWEQVDQTTATSPKSVSEISKVFQNTPPSSAEKPPVPLPRRKLINNRTSPESRKPDECSLKTADDNYIRVSSRQIGESCQNECPIPRRRGRGSKMADANGESVAGRTTNSENNDSSPQVPNCNSTASPQSFSRKDKVVWTRRDEISSDLQRADRPLPEGPPPEKPPRTFKHDLLVETRKQAQQNKSNSDCLQDSPPLQRGRSVKELSRAFEGKQITNGDMSPTAIKNPSVLNSSLHSTNDKEMDSHQITPKINIDNVQVRHHLTKNQQRPKTEFVSPYAITSCSLLGTPKKPIKNQLSSEPFQTVPKSRSKFFVDLTDGSVGGKTNNFKLKRYFSEEHLYDEPDPGPNSEESVFVNDIYSTYSGLYAEPYNQQKQNVKNTQDLHYLCTPIVPRRHISPVRSRSKSVSVAMEKKSASSHWPKALRLHRDLHKSRKPSVNAEVREMVNQSFSRVSRYRRPDNQDKEATDDDSGDSDCELSPNELEERIVYMRSVSRAASMRSEKPYKHESIHPQLFDYILIVGLQNSDANNSYEPYIKHKFPLDIPVNKAYISHFCFPDAEVWQPTKSGETYTFVLTSETGDRTFGYCRRIKPDESPVCLPIVYCIVSPIMAFDFYSKVLQELEQRHGISDNEMASFFRSLQQHYMPKPGVSIRVCDVLEDGRDIVTLTRPEDPTLENFGVYQVLQILDVSNLIKVYASILLERKIIFCASSLSQLSRCIQGLTNLLFPFTWQHTFIPILPSKLLEAVCSPVPYIIGILSHLKPKLLELPLDQVLIVDLDQNRLLKQVGDELKVIPKKIQKALITAMKMAKNVQDPTDVSCGLVITEAFLRMFVETLGHYNNYIVTQQDGKKVFEREAFCQSAPTRGIMSFLQWFTETQMFSIFISSRLENTAVKGPFEKRIQEYKDEMESTPQNFKGNVKELGKRVKTLGERLINFKTPLKV